MKRLLLIGCLSTLLSSVTVYAAPPIPAGDLVTQSTTVEEPISNEVRWYQVELLIFKQRPISSEISEVWPKDITLSYPDNWETLKTTDDYQALYQKKPLVNTPFILLDKKYFQLSGIKNKLQVNRNDILFHGAWRQSLTQNLDQNMDADGVSILIRGGNHYDDHTELEGSISLSLLRYLHVHTNLWLTHFIPAGATAAPVAGVDAKLSPEQMALANWPTLPVFPFVKANASAVSTMTPTSEGTETNPAVEKKYEVDEIVINKQSRRMRSYETHYIDHPRFGMLIRIVPLDTNTLQPIPKK